MQSHSTIFGTTQEEEAFLAALHPTIAYMARHYRFLCTRLSLDPDDLAQEGMIAAWRALSAIQRPIGARKYCLIAARGAMLDIISDANKKHAISLEAYLSFDDGDGSRELPDTAHPTTLSSYTKRRAVLRLLREALTAKQASVIMADYGIDRAAGGCVETREEVEKRLALSASGYLSLRRRALARLAELAPDA